MDIKHFFEFKAIYLLAFLAFSLNIYSFHNQKVGKITGEISIDLKQEKIASELNYEYVAAENDEKEIKFYLNEKFDVNDVKCRNCLSFTFDKKANPLPTIKITLKKSLKLNERLPIKIKYAGSLKELYFKDYEFLELGLDYFWFPIHPNFSQYKFLYKIKVKAVPEFQLISNGRVTKKGSYWLVESRVPDFDIDLVLGKNLKIESYRENDYNLQVASKNLPEKVPATLLENMRETLEFYNSTFGINSPQKEVTAVIRPHPPIPGYGGYFRTGYFILSKTEQPETFLFPVAHELAHNWWLTANQQNAWINESFAEYTAMLALRKLRGEEAFAEQIKKKEKLNKDLPPVYGFDRTKNPKQAPMILYVKGTLKLNELENAIGEERFMKFLREASETKIKTTDELIEVLARTESRETADKFLDSLKK